MLSTVMNASRECLSLDHSTLYYSLDPSGNCCLFFLSGISYHIRQSPSVQWIIKRDLLKKVTCLALIYLPLSPINWKQYGCFNQVSAVEAHTPQSSLKHHSVGVVGSPYIDLGSQLLNCCTSIRKNGFSYLLLNTVIYSP